MAQIGLSSRRQARVLVVDDHPMVLDAAKNALLASQVAESVDCVASLQQARDLLARDTTFALIVLDLSLADANRLEALLALREDHPDVPVLVFSGDESPETIANAFECSARGYVPKNQQVAVLVNAARTVLAGGTYIPIHALRTLGADIAPAPSHANDARPALPNITSRQTDVYRLLLQGMPNKVIAARLDMSVHTVKAHVSALFGALQVHNRAQAVLRGRQYGLI
jgi:two-component system, NarL family, nitrate/nitrite response regulator NarL